MKNMINKVFKRKKLCMHHHKSVPVRDILYGFMSFNNPNPCTKIKSIMSNRSITLYKQEIIKNCSHLYILYVYDVEVVKTIVPYEFLNSVNKELSGQ